MPDFTPEQLREIESRCEAAKPYVGTDVFAKRQNITTEISNFRLVERTDEAPMAYVCDRAVADFMAAAFHDIPDLLAALKQATEERDRFAAALERSRTSLADIAGRFKRHDVLKSDLAGIANAALLEVSDPAECLKARDAEIRQKVCVEAIVVARETAGPKARVIQALHDHFAKDLPEYEEIQELLRKVAAPTQARADSEEGKR